MLKTTEPRLAQQAYEKVLDLILSGQAQPGDLLNERRLADLLAMSRTPVRDALLMLEGEGLLVRQGNRGLMVKQMKIEDYMDVLQIRMLLEPAVTRMATGKIADVLWEPLVERLNALIVEGEKGQADRAEIRDVDEQLHGLISGAADNPQLSSMILTLRRRTQIFDLKSLPERLEDTCREHLEIIRYLRAGDGAAAAQAMTTHLENVKASIIRRLTGG